MSGGETSLSGYDNASQALSYTPGQEQVYLNGILLVRGDDYTATNGTSITGLSALAASDFVQINCYNNFSVATTPATSITGTIANNQLANSAITINGSAISLGGTVTLAGDIESVTAGTGLTGGGSSGALTLGLSTPVSTTNGGTGLSTFTTGDLVYASGADTLAKRSIGTTGQVLTVSGGLPEWSALPATTPTFIGCIAINTDQNTPFTTVGTEVSIPFAQTELVDTHNFHSTSSNPSRFTIPTGYGGKYLIQLNTTLASHNPDLYIYILKNGSKLVSADGIVNGQIVRQANAYPQGDTLNVGLVVTGVAGDYFQWNIVVQSAGSGTNTIDRARCSFTYLGA